MWRHIASNALTIFVVMLFLIGGLVKLTGDQYNTPGPLAEGVCLKIERGSTMRLVSEQLKEQGAISSSAIFRMGADYAGKSQELKAGSFLIEPGASMAEIVDLVTRAGASTCGTEIVYRIGVTRATAQMRRLDPTTNRFDDVGSFTLGETPPPIYQELLGESDTRFRVALAEGVTSWQVMTQLNAIETLVDDLSEVPSEGSLAPDSYEFQPGDSVAEIIARMQERQAALLESAWADRVDGLPVETPQEALVLASIIEKETGIAEERRLVASVFVNRLNRGIRLQTDPTVIYGITQGKEPLGRGLRRSELRGQTPYNTYVIDGLPPTPIANPGAASIRAALDPAESNFIFFVADGSGGHAFAETLDEHNQNVARWRAIEAQQSNN